MIKSFTKFRTLFVALFLSSLLLQVISTGAFAQSPRSATERKNFDQTPTDSAKSKLSPDMEDSVAQLNYGRRKDAMQKVIVTLETNYEIDSMVNGKADEQQFDLMLNQEVGRNKQIAGILITDMVSMSGKVRKSFNRLGMLSAEIPLSKIEELSQNPNVAYISPDRAVSSMGHIATTSGANNAWGSVSGCQDCRGTGVGIAVLDSGIDANHYLFQNGGARTVVFSKDFTGQGTTSDLYGHGTHVASMASGSYFFGSGYNGIAPYSNLLNLRVLDDQGRGLVSNAVAAVDWAIANKAAYNIRVINMSLGTPPKDSYVNDPLCKAARRAYNAGILVVAAAGNNGKDALGKKLYGYIDSPGIEPSVLTVGAANTYGTNERNDDTVTTFSSRGPTRGYTVVNNVRNYDNLIKPDLVAPGNKIIGAASADAASNSNSIVNKFPTLVVSKTAASASRVMYLSGTSMAAPIVSGTAAILFQARPDLTPALAKAVLMYTAQPIKGANTLEQGAGLLNVKGATEVVNLLKPEAATLPAGSDMLIGPLTNQQKSGQCSFVFSSTCYPWGKGIVTNFGFLYGDSLMTTKQGIYTNGVLISDGTAMSGKSLVKTNLTSAGVNIFQGAIKINSNGVLISDGSLFMQSSALGNDTLGNGVLISDGVLVSDGVLISDANPQADNYINGDNTAYMAPE